MIRTTFSYLVFKNFLHLFCDETTRKERVTNIVRVVTQSIIVNVLANMRLLVCLTHQYIYVIMQGACYRTFFWLDKYIVTLNVIMDSICFILEEKLKFLKTFLQTSFTLY